MSKHALHKYNQVKVNAEVNEANAHKLVQMLMSRALEKMQLAKTYMQQGVIGLKGENISMVISIIGGLQASLDIEQGGELASSLNDLYDYMKRKLLEANVLNKVECIDEVYNLLATIKSGWDGIEAEAAIILSKQAKSNNE